MDDLANVWKTHNWNGLDAHLALRQGAAVENRRENMKMASPFFGVLTLFAAYNASRTILISKRNRATAVGGLALSFFSYAACGIAAREPMVKPVVTTV